MNKDKIQPFPNGSSFGDWHCVNCDECRKGYDYEESDWNCDLEYAVDLAYMGTGEIPADMGRRLGYKEEGYVAYRCPEFIGRGGDWDNEWPPYPDPWSGGHIEAGQMDMSLLWSLPEVQELVETEGALS